MRCSFEPPGRKAPKVIKVSSSVPGRVRTTNRFARTNNAHSVTSGISSTYCLPDLASSVVHSYGLAAAKIAKLADVARENEVVTIIGLGTSGESNEHKNSCTSDARLCGRANPEHGHRRGH